MTWWPLVGLSGASAALLLMMGWEMAPTRAASDARGVVARSQPSPEMVNDSIAPAADITALLQRPLFNWDRRPGVSSMAGKADDEMPRLSGIMIGGKERWAIFAPRGDEHPVTVQEGGTFGRFTVISIAQDHVEIGDAAGSHRLRTQFSQPPNPTVRVGSES